MGPTLACPLADTTFLRMTKNVAIIPINNPMTVNTTAVTITLTETIAALDRMYGRKTCTRGYNMGYKCKMCQIYYNSYYNYC